MSNVVTEDMSTPNKLAVTFLRRLFLMEVTHDEDPETRNFP